MESKSKIDFKADSVTEDDPVDTSTFKMKRSNRSYLKYYTAIKK